MSVWAKSQQLPMSAIKKIHLTYESQQFPIEVRHFCSQWIEDKIWKKLYTNVDDPEQYECIASLIKSLFEEIEKQASSLNDPAEHFIVKYRLLQAAENLQLKYAARPVELFKVILHCLAYESRLITEHEKNLPDSNDVDGSVSSSGTSTQEIEQELELLKHRTEESVVKLKQIENDLEAFDLACHEFSKVQLRLQMNQLAEIDAQVSTKKDILERELRFKMSSILQQRLDLVDKIKGTLHRVELLQTKVIQQELNEWRKNQQLAGNGKPFVCTLDAIQVWCEGLIELICVSHKQIQKIDRLRRAQRIEDPVGVQDHLPILMTQVTRLLTDLVLSTFLIEKQPPQVMKTNSRFSSSVRLLVGGKLNVQANPPTVKVTVINEAKAAAMSKDVAGWKIDSAGEILNNSGKMEYEPSNTKLFINFKNLQLKKIKRGKQRRDDCVLDEKFCLMFETKFSVGDIMFKVWTLSLPVVVIVHCHQEPHAWGTITWDNAFSEQGREPFEVTNQMPWCKIAEAINMKMKSATGQILNPDSLRVLAEKAFRIDLDDPLNQNFSNMTLTWSAFGKDCLPNRNFTFWEWIYSLMKLTRDHLLEPWNQGLIAGFVTRKQTEQMLARCSPGTFILRFSESSLGGISIAWVDSQKQINMIQPFTNKDLSLRSLPDRLSDFSQLIYLYPDIPKDQAYSKFYTAEEKPQKKNGYVKLTLVNRMPGCHQNNAKVVSRTSSNFSIADSGYPHTANSIYSSTSPDSSSSNQMSPESGPLSPE